MTASGTARSTPRHQGWCATSSYCASTSMTPSTRPPSSTPGKDWNRATSATASAGTMSSSRFVADSGFCNGASRTPPSPASAPPAPHAPAAIASTDQPKVAAARGFSVAAVAASPTVVNRKTAHAAAMSTTTAASRTNTSTPTDSPNSSTVPVGSTVGEVRTAPANISVSDDWRMISRPRVAISRSSAVASRSGRMTSTWNPTPMPTVDATASTAARTSGSPHGSRRPWKA